MTEAPKYFIQVPVITAQAKNLSSTDKLVFGEIFTMLNTEKKCWLTNTGIGNRINKNKTTIRNSVKKLKSLGYLKTKVISNGHENSKRFAYAPCIGGTKFGTTKKSTPVVPNKVHRSYQIKYPSKSNSKSINKSVTNNGKPSIRQMIVKDLESLMVNINTFVAQDINYWIDNYDPKLILKAIHQVGSTSPSPAWVVKDISTQLARGCRVHQPKRSHRYNHQTIQGQLPKWARDDYHEKLHPTSKKLQKKIQKQLKDLNNRGNKK